MASSRRTCEPSPLLAANLRSSSALCSDRLTASAAPIRSLHRANRRWKSVNQNSAVLGTRHRVIVIAGWYYRQHCETPLMFMSADRHALRRLGGLSEECSFARLKSDNHASWG